MHGQHSKPVSIIAVNIYLLMILISDTIHIIIIETIISDIDYGDLASEEIQF